MSDIRTPEPRHQRGGDRHERERSMKVVAGGSSAAALAGAAAAVLAILGLLNVLPFYMLTIATIVVGISFLLQASAMASRSRQLMNEAADDSGAERGQLVGGMGVEGIGAAAGIALGVLGLLGLAPGILIPIAAITLGAALLVGASATQQLNELAARYQWTNERTRNIATQSINSAAGIQVLVGAAAAVLGVLALLDISPLTLTLVAMLTLGGGMLLIGGGISGALGSVTRR